MLLHLNICRGGWGISRRLRGFPEAGSLHKRPPARQRTEAPVTVKKTIICSTDWKHAASSPVCVVIVSLMSRLALTHFYECTRKNDESPRNYPSACSGCSRRNIVKAFLVGTFPRAAVLIPSVQICTARPISWLWFQSTENNMQTVFCCKAINMKEMIQVCLINVSNLKKNCSPHCPGLAPPLSRPEA